VFRVGIGVLGIDCALDKEVATLGAYLPLYNFTSPPPHLFILQNLQQPAFTLQRTAQKRIVIATSARHRLNYSPSGVPFPRALMHKLREILPSSRMTNASIINPSFQKP
jgi:hypothetical protein